MPTRLLRSLLLIGLTSNVAGCGYQTANVHPPAAHEPQNAHPHARATPTIDRSTPILTPVPPRSPHAAATTATPSSEKTPRTGAVTYDLSILRGLQAAADRRDPKYTYLLDPVAAVRGDLPKLGFGPDPVSILSPAPPAPSPTAHPGEDGQPETDVIVSYRGRRYWIVLNQFVRQGAAGIWSVITVTPM